MKRADTLCDTEFFPLSFILLEEILPNSFSQMIRCDRKIHGMTGGARIFTEIVEFLRQLLVDLNWRCDTEHPNLP
jgi:hypothetical protein